jgi:hypothetical protein
VTSRKATCWLGQNREPWSMAAIQLVAQQSHSIP